MQNEQIVLISIGKDELRELVADAVAASLSTLPKEGDGLPEWLTRKEVAEYLSVSVGTVDGLVRQGVLPKHSVGGLVRFKRPEVRKVMETYTRYGRSE